MDELLADPLIERFRAKHPELDEQYDPDQSEPVYQLLRNIATVRACPGLERCPNDFEGHYTLLQSKHGGGVQIYDRKVSCKKFIARQNEEQIRSRIRSFYIDETALNNGGYSAEEIMTNDLEPHRRQLAS